MELNFLLQYDVAAIHVREVYITKERMFVEFTCRCVMDGNTFPRLVSVANIRRTMARNCLLATEEIVQTPILRQEFDDYEYDCTTCL